MIKVAICKSMKDDTINDEMAVALVKDLLNKAYPEEEINFIFPKKIEEGENIGAHVQEHVLNLITSDFVAFISKTDGSLGSHTINEMNMINFLKKNFIWIGKKNDMVYLFKKEVTE